MDRNGPRRCSPGCSPGCSCPSGTCIARRSAEEAPPSSGSENPSANSSSRSTQCRGCQTPGSWGSSPANSNCRRSRPACCASCLLQSQKVDVVRDAEALQRIGIYLRVMLQYRIQGIYYRCYAISQSAFHLDVRVTDIRYSRSVLSA